MRLKLAFLLCSLIAACLAWVLLRELDVLPGVAALGFVWFLAFGGLSYLILKKARADRPTSCAIAGAIAGSLYFLIPILFVPHLIHSVTASQFVWVGSLAVVGAMSGLCFRAISGPFATQEEACASRRHSVSSH